jgi:hypothetical protein
LDIERSSVGILEVAQLTDHPWRTLHIYRKLTIYKKANKNTARTNCTSKTSRRAEMLGILASMRNSSHLTKIMYSTKEFSVSKVIQIKKGTIEATRIKSIRSWCDERLGSIKISLQRYYKRAYRGLLYLMFYAWNNSGNVDDVRYEGNSISKLQIQAANYVFELSAGNCHR